MYAVAIVTLLMWSSYRTIARVFKWLTGVLTAYIATAFVAGVDWRAALGATLLPRVEWTRAFFAVLVAILGTTISPYLFFWQSAHRIEELRDEPEGGDEPVPMSERPHRQATRKERTSRLDVFAGMAFSNIVMFAIIVGTGSTLGAHGSTTITTAAQAAEALRPIAGSWSETLFALGFIGSGMLAIPVLAGAGSVGMAGLLHKEWGFSKSVKDAPVFYGLVILGTLGGTLITLTGVDPVKLLVYSALINGLLAAPFLVIVMIVSNDATALGQYTNGKLARTLGWFATVLMALAAIAYLVLTYGT
jgi:Mn2+/Fe2+ NRAMP family transporter